MAKVNIPAVTCDVCSRSELVNGIKVEPVRIRLGEVEVSGDLCEEHSKPVREAIAVLPRKPRQRRRASFEDSVVSSPDEIPRSTD